MSKFKVGDKIKVKSCCLYDNGKTHVITRVRNLTQITMYYVEEKTFCPYFFEHNIEPVLNNHSKPKVGDRVRCVCESPTDSRWMKEGETGTVVKGPWGNGLGGSYDVKVDSRSGTKRILGDCIEVIEKEPSKFKVGDSVCAIDDDPEGFFGTVIEVDPDDDVQTYLVKFPEWERGHGKDGRNWWMREDQIVEASSPELQEGRTLTDCTTATYSPMLGPMTFSTLTTTIDELKNNKEEDVDRLRSIPKTLKRVLDKDYKAFYQLGWVNGDLKITTDGKEELLDFLLQEHKTELGKIAQAEVKEIKEEDK